MSDARIPNANNDECLVCGGRVANPILHAEWHKEIDRIRNLVIRADAATRRAR